MEIVKTYRLGHTYRDTGRLNSPDDQFLSWLNQPGSGMKNMSGVRPLKFLHLPIHAPAAIVLVTGEPSSGSASNPWEDVVDIRHGSILYWGDAKFGAKTVDEFPGNRALRDAWNQVLDGQVGKVPPILHFSRRESGYLSFNGLCVLERLELTWYEDHGRPVRNYRAHLTILDQEFVDVSWVRSRVAAGSASDLTGHGPAAWRRYQDGYLDRLRVWAPSIRLQRDQIPDVGTSDASLLLELVQLSPTEFEAAVVSIFTELKDVHHDITRTQPSGDGGFDFFGRFRLPPPIRYEIPFRGEAKRYSRAVPVRPKDVSRLVARLGRGEYGIFVTTSYFTQQAQSEVLEDAYPTELLSGADLVKMLRELRLANGSSLRPSWLRTVEAEAREPVAGLRRIAEAPTSYEVD